MMVNFKITLFFWRSVSGKLLGCISCQDFWVKTLPCFVQLTRFQACRCGGGTSLLEERCRTGLFSELWIFFSPLFFNREKHKVLNCISFSWLQLPGQNWLYKWLFQRCQRHSAKSSWSYRNRHRRKNKHLGGEEQRSGGGGSRKSKGNWREKNVGREKMRGEESAPRQILPK